MAIVPTGGIEGLVICKHYSMGVLDNLTITIYYQFLILDIVRIPKSVNHAQCTICGYIKQIPKIVCTLLGCHMGVLWADRG